MVCWPSFALQPRKIASLPGWSDTVLPSQSGRANTPSFAGGGVDMGSDLLLARRETIPPPLVALNTASAVTAIDENDASRKTPLLTMVPVELAGACCDNCASESPAGAGACM